MSQNNPYQAPTPEPKKASPPASSTRRLWLAYGIAPITTPFLAAIVAVTLSLFYQTSNPQDVNANPMSLILAPVFILILGIPLAYFLTLVIGMPFVFWLNRRQRLNFVSIHVSAILMGVVVGTGPPLIIALLSMLGPEPIYGGLLQAMAFNSTNAVLLFLPTAFTFWLIGVK